MGKIGDGCRGGAAGAGPWLAAADGGVPVAVAGGCPAEVGVKGWGAGKGDCAPACAAYAADSANASR